MAKLYTLLKADEKQIRKIIVKELEANGYVPIINKDFIYAEGTHPVMLIAHYDTVPKPPRFVQNNKGVLSAKSGLGADDRAGIYAIFELIRKHHCHVLFTGGEETGGIGAKAFAKSGLAPDEVNYCLQFDRRGGNDAVYYDGDNEEFEKFITQHGWATAIGTYTDICEVAPYLGVAAVNLSVGYQNEHHDNETLDLNVMNANIKRYGELLGGPKFEWVQGYSLWGSYLDDDYWDDTWTGNYRSKSGVAKLYEIVYIDPAFDDEEECIDYAEGVSPIEAIGDFMIRHPDISFEYVLDWYGVAAADSYRVA